MTDIWTNRETDHLEDLDEATGDLSEMDLDLDALAADPDRSSDARVDPFEDEVDTRSLACFEGDTGRLDYAQRRVLHALMKHRYISADRHPDHWVGLLSNEDLIKSRLNDLFLDLHIDRTYQVAFKRQAVTETGAPLPTLLHEVAHNKEETIMLVALRGRFFRQRQDGDNVVYVEKSALLDEVAGMRPDHATDRAFNQKKTERAIEGLRIAGVLLKTPDPDRFRISPVVEVLLPLPKLRELMTWLITQNGTDAGPDTSKQVTLDEAGADDGEES